MTARAIGPRAAITDDPGWIVALEHSPANAGFP